MADFQKHVPDFEQRDTTIVAASGDDPEDAAKMRAAEGLTFDVAHSVDVPDFAERYGSFFNPDKGCLHATGFVLEESGTVAHAVYATGSIGRLTPDATIRAIDFMISQAS